MAVRRRALTSGSRVIVVRMFASYRHRHCCPDARRCLAAVRIDGGYKPLRLLAGDGILLFPSQRIRQATHQTQNVPARLFQDVLGIVEGDPFFVLRDARFFEQT